jgi:hypothetical protein
VEGAALVGDVVDPADDLPGVVGVVDAGLLGPQGDEAGEFAVDAGEGALLEDDDEVPVEALAEGEGGLPGVQAVEEEAEGELGELVLEARQEAVGALELAVLLVVSVALPLAGDVFDELGFDGEARPEGVTSLASRT